MADVTVAASSQNNATQRYGPVWTTSLVGYVFIQNGTTAQLTYRKTTDGGATWGSAVNVSSASTSRRFDIWFDRWTPGDSGTKIHVLWTNSSSQALYRSLDTSSDTLGTETTIATMSSSDTNPIERCTTQICKLRGGNLLAVFVTANQMSSNTGTYRSTDGGANWTSRAVTWAEGSGGGAVGFTPGDVGILLPGKETGTNDAWLLYWDQDASAITTKVYSESGNSWTESASFATSMALSDTSSYQGPQWGAVQRHSDNHVFVAAFSAYKTSAADLKVWELTAAGGGTATARTTAYTHDSTNVATGGELFIDQQSGDLYVAYSKGASDTARKLYYKKSSDGGVTWGTETAYTVGTAHILDTISAGHSIKAGDSGRFEPVVIDRTAGNAIVNFDNTAAIGVSTIKTRRTLSPLGTRIGSRQVRAN